MEKMGRPQYTAEQRAYHQEVGQRIKKARLAKNLEVGDISIELDLDESIWRRWEAGTRAPSLWRLRQIATSLDVTPEKLLGSRA